MVLKDTALAIINGAVNSNNHDKVEAYQFISDNGYWEDLTSAQLLVLRELIETGKVFTAPLYFTLPNLKNDD